MTEHIHAPKPDAAAVARPVPRARLVVGPAGDRYEQEADRIADAVMQVSTPSDHASPPARIAAMPAQAGTVQRQCSACASKEDELLQRDPTGTGAPAVTAPLRAGIDAQRSGGGAPLAAATRAFMQDRIGYDFSDVRVHADARAAQSASSLWARAFTIGRDIFFNAGEYAPETAAGRRLIAHELAHVVQQGSGVPAGIQRQAAGGTQKPVEQLSQYEIDSQWPTRKAEFIQVASSPNKLGGHQLFAIWHSYWYEMQNLAVSAERRADKAVWSVDRIAYADNKYLFQQGKRDALGPEYQAAADRLDATNFMLLAEVRLLNWLEDWVDTGGHHLVISEVNNKAIEIAKAIAMFQDWFAPIIYAGLGAVSGGGTSGGGAINEGALADEETLSVKPPSPPSLRIIQGGGGTTPPARVGGGGAVRTGGGARGATATAPAIDVEEAPATSPNPRPSLTLVPEEAPTPQSATSPATTSPSSATGISPALALALAQTYQNPDDVKQGPCNVRDVKGHLGGNTAHNNFATTVTGGNPNDFRITSPEGWDCVTDGRDLRRPNVVWEVKVGHDWVSDAGVAGGSIDAPRLMKRLLGLEKQRIDCSLAAARCGYSYRFAVDSLEVAQALNVQWKGTPPVYCFNRDGTPCKT